MSIIIDLREIARDCDDCSKEAENKGDQRAYRAIAARIRAVLRKLES